MIPEVEVLPHVDDVVWVVSVFSPQGVQNLHLYQRLVVEPKQQKLTNRPES